MNSATLHGLAFTQTGEIEAPAYMEVRGRSYPVAAMVQMAPGVEKPLLDIPQMSDFTWQLSALKSRMEKPEAYEAIEDVAERVAALWKWLWDHIGEATPEQRRQMERGLAA